MKFHSGMDETWKMWNFVECGYFMLTLIALYFGWPLSIYMGKKLFMLFENRINPLKGKYKHVCCCHGSQAYLRMTPCSICSWNTQSRSEDTNLSVYTLACCFCSWYCCWRFYLCYDWCWCCCCCCATCFLWFWKSEVELQKLECLTKFLVLFQTIP